MKSKILCGYLTQFIITILALVILYVVYDKYLKNKISEGFREGMAPKEWKEIVKKLNNNIKNIDNVGEWQEILDLINRDLNIGMIEKVKETLKNSKIVSNKSGMGRIRQEDIDELTNIKKLSDVVVSLEDYVTNEYKDKE
jgi:hypothetical protein